MILSGSAMILIAVFVEAQNPHFWNGSQGTGSTPEYYFVMGTIFILLAIRSLRAAAGQRRKSNERGKRNDDT